MEDIKALVDGYCQITGRPAFTITVDEFIKFHQLSRFRSPLSSTSPEKAPEIVTKKQEETPTLSVETLPKISEETTEKVAEVTPAPEGIKSKEVKESPITKPSSQIVPKKENVPTKNEPRQNNIALEMLKSIKG